MVLQEHEESVAVVKTGRRERNSFAAEILILNAGRIHSLLDILLAVQALHKAVVEEGHIEVLHR